MSECPHENIVFCPLYIAAHDGRESIGCDDGRSSGWEGCAVSRGLDYAKAVARLNPRFVEACRKKEQAESGREQRRRNMILSGVR